MEEKKKNKGIEIRDRKRAKNRKKMATVKDNQIGLCCFAIYKEKEIKRQSGKYKPTGRYIEYRGLQIENKLYLDDGKHKLVNRSTMQLVQKFKAIPQWASPYLLQMYRENVKTENKSADQKDTETNTELE